MLDRVGQAKEIAQRGDWASLTQYLQQFLQTNPVSTLTQTEIQALFPLIMKVLAAGDFSLRWDVAKIVPTFGKIAISPLVDLLHSETAALEARWFAARILGDLHDPDGIRVLVELVQNRDEDDLAEMAAGALANLGPPAIAALSELLTDDTTRPLAVQALAQIRRSETISPLLTVVGDAESSTRAMVIEALSSFHDPRIAPVLVNGLKDPAAPVRRAAIAGLASRSDLVDALNLVNLFSDCLWDVNLEVCHQAALALGRVGEEAAVLPLLRVLQSASLPASLQQVVIRALGWIGTQAALEGLQHSLLSQPELNLAQETKAEIVAEIVAVLGRWANPDLKPLAAQGLVAALALTHSNQPNPYLDAKPQSNLRAAIALALGQLQQPQTLDALIGLLADADDQVRLHAIAALKTFQAQSIRGQLEALQTSPEISASLQQGIAIALTEWQIELPQ